MKNTLAKKKFYQLRCIGCGQEFSELESCTFCPKCGDPLDVVYDYGFVRSRLNEHNLKTAPISAMKYLSLYPILDFSKIVSLREGGTPLIRCKNLTKKYKVKNLYVKNEGLNPTGVFKDRGTMVEVTKALEIGAKAMCLASTGNMAASVAAYASLAGLPCYILVPEGTPAGKITQTMSYGARVLQIRASYSECARLAVEMARRHNFYLAGDYVFRLEGQKSQGFEIIEQLLWKAPDYVVCPMGCGTNLSAIWKGFREFYELGLVDKLPKMIGVQTENCQVIAEAFRKRRRDFTPAKKIETVCGAIAVNNPLDGKKALAALYESKGRAVAVKDEAAMVMGNVLAREEAVFVEPSGALGLAAVDALAKKGFFKKSDTVVVMATGNGLKDSGYILKTLPDPPALEADMAEIDNYIKQKLYNFSSKISADNEKPLWKKTPTAARLRQIIKKEFNTTLPATGLTNVLTEARAFEDKGREVTRQNLRSIIEEELNQATPGEAILEVLDFSTKTSLKSEARAKIKLRYDKQEIEAEARGVGTVDALVTALKRAIKNLDVMFVQTTDYNVVVDSGGADAVVKVYMTLRDKNGNQVKCTATSPDVVVASVKAFEKGYNILHNKNFTN